MKSNLKSLVMGVLLGSLIATATAQTAPTTMNFQGRLTRLNGKALPDGQYVVTIRLWKDLTSTNTNDLLISWQSLSVQVRSGVFSTVLPNLTEAVLAGGVAYLEIEPAGQGPLSPRVPLLSVPFAVLAGTVFDNAITHQKLDDDILSLPKISKDLLHMTTFPSGSLGVGTNNPQRRLHVWGSGVNGGAGLFESLNQPNSVTIVGASTSSSPAVFSLIDSAGSSASMVLTGPANGGESNSLAFLTNSGAERMRITRSGDIGVGTVTPTAKLDVAGPVHFDAVSLGGLPTAGAEINFARVPGSKLNFYQDVADGLFGIGVSDTSLQFFIPTEANRLFEFCVGKPGAFTSRVSISTNGTIETTGNMRISGNGFKPGGGPWADLNSDRRLKTEVKPLENALDQFLALRGVSYRFKNPEELGERAGLRRGFIAQEVESTFPDWVVTKPNGYKTIAFDSGFDALTVEAVRELSSRLDRETKARTQLEVEVAIARGENAQLRKELASIREVLSHMAGTK